VKNCIRLLVLSGLTTLALSFSLVAQVAVVPRTVTTNSFAVTWSPDPDAEAITSIEWAGLGNQNLTNSFAVGSCNGGDVEYFGNSWAPPDPQIGGFVLVGGGTTGQSWTGRTLGNDAARVAVHSDSTGCPPSSASVPVKTTYRFLDEPREDSNTFEVQRSFDFAATPFAHNFRPYIPRFTLNLGTGGGFTELIYPVADGTLTTVSVFNCPVGCTGPIVPAGSNASPLSQPLDPRKNWFVIHNPANGAGVLVSRHRSFNQDGGRTAVQLWVDFDGGSNSNASSFLLLSPNGGFRSRLTEAESLCFFINPAWTAASRTLPPGCRSQGLEDRDDDGDGSEQ
jgi:hypothetical protein